MQKVYAVIMAGGVGSRFWPRSRERSPKQLLEIIQGGTMIQDTVKRVGKLVPPEQIFIVTNKLQVEEITRQLPGIPVSNILVEPVGRNTAPCVGLAALRIQSINPEGVMVALPADHLIRNEEEFLRVLRIAIRIAEEREALVTIGINPTHPETGYGYIQCSDEDGQFNPYKSEGAFRVKTFAEKPNYETAIKFLQSGDFLWNSGMFAWKAKTVLQEIQTHLPELAEQLHAIKISLNTEKYQSVLETAYGLIRGISIDYGVMEKAGNVFVVKGDFGWSDVGSWDEVVRLSKSDEKGCIHRGNVITIDSKGNFIDAGKKIVAAIGIENLIVISTDDALLICEKGRSQEVKEIVDYIRRKQMNEYL